MSGGAGPEVTTETLTDGMMGCYARPAGEGPHPGMVVLMEAFGLNDFVRGFCGDMARAGYAAVAPDLYQGDVYDYSDIDAIVAKVRTLTDDWLMARTGDALDWLAGRPDVAGDRLGCIGFCMGGRLAFLAACEHPQSLRAAVSFYGGGIAPDQDPLGRAPALDRVPGLRTPLLLCYGANDPQIAPAEHARVAHALSESGARYVISVFPYAGHGFMREGHPDYSPHAAEEAWRQTLGFLGEYLV